MPDETVIDGEICSLDESGRPSFNTLQNYIPGGAPLLYYVFDVVIVAGRDVMSQPMASRRELLRGSVLSSLGEAIRESPEFHAGLLELIQSVKALGLEGLVAKRRDSRYEPGQRSAST
jgi:bifunctional non-homologous end joining protein LigD